VIRLLAILILLFATRCASAQTTAGQAFRVNVPTSAAITAAGGLQQLVHDETNADQVFSPQNWTVKANAPGGVSVSFTAQTPFNHVNQPFQRDVGLALAVGNIAGPGSWNVGTADAASDYASGLSEATVSASSNGIGRAELALTVRFITDTFGTFATGDYNTTIVGTVTAN